MANITPIQIVEQTRFNNSIASASKQSDASLFRLLLAMAHGDATQTLKIKSDNNDGFVVSQPVSYYRNPAFKQSSADFSLQNEYSKSVQIKDFTHIKLLKCIHPQSLSAFDDPLHIDEEVLENSALPAKQRLAKQAQALSNLDHSIEVGNEIDQEPTLLFDILESMDQIRL